MSTKAKEKFCQSKLGIAEHRVAETEHEKGFKVPEDEDQQEQTVDVDEGFIKSRLREIKEKQAELDEVQAQLQKELTEAEERIRSKPGFAAIPRREQNIQQKVDALREACEGHKEELLEGHGKRSFSFSGIGKVGWRKSGGGVKNGPGNSTKDVCQKLPERFIRRKPSVDKTAVKKALREGEVTEEQLQEWGLAYSEKEDNWYFKLA